MIRVSPKRTDAYRFLLALPRYDKRGAASLKPGFDRIAKLLQLVGNPHQAYPIAHVAGTNGKGSTSSMVSAICTSAGVRAGLQTSPHLFSVTERMRIDGVPASDEWLARTVHLLRRPIEQIGPSFFEATTALSFLYFAEQNVDLAVVEVGLGGRLDATNIVEPTVCVITAIGIDHVAILGNSLRSIATEKAGIIKAGVPVFTSNTNEDVLDVLQKTAERKDAPLYQTTTHFPVAEILENGNPLVVEIASRQRSYGQINLDLVGKHQLDNALLAVATSEALLGESVKDPVKVFRHGLENTRLLSGLRGRLDVISNDPLVVVDVGHNSHGVQAALAFTRRHCSGKLHVGIGLLRDKDHWQIAQSIAQYADFAHVIPLTADRAINSDLLEGSLTSHGAKIGRRGTSSEVFEWFSRNSNAEDGLLLVGSHQVVAQLDQKLLENGLD